MIDATSYDVPIQRRILSIEVNFPFINIGIVQLILFSPGLKAINNEIIAFRRLTKVSG